MATPHPPAHAVNRMLTDSEAFPTLLSLTAAWCCA